jgi:hypothetical protein
MNFSALHALVAAIPALSADSILSGPAWTAEGNQNGAWFGASSASAGDVDGDGFSDVIVGAPTYDNGELGEGRAFLFLGGANGLSTTPAWTAEGDQTNAEFGNCVATAGDVNGDGFSDVIVGAWQYDSRETNEGRVFVYLGSSTGLSTSAAWTAEGNQLDGGFGAAVATAGDVNGDGFSDVIVGAWQYDGGETDEGRASVYLGSSSGLSANPAWTAESDQADAHFGISVAPAGDVDGDGFDDVIVGADQYDNGEQDEGRAYVYRGSSSGLAATPVWTTESNQALAHTGLAVATAGDVDGDGFSDVIVGSIFFGNGQLSEGRTLVYLGSAAGLSTSAAWTAESDQDFAAFGSAVETAGDVNGDGYSDVIVAARGFDNGELNEGRTFVYLGSGDGLSTVAAWTAEGDQLGARFGWSVATAGDVNGDGYSDAIVGANLFENGQASEGRAFVYMGSSALLAAAPVWTAVSAQPNGAFTNFASAGDVDGDGYSDAIVGAPMYDTSRGRAFVYRGSAAGLSPSFSWTAGTSQIGSRFGESVASAGDVNGDGYSDVIVGAPRFDGEKNEGLAFVYHGSSSGLSTIAAWSGQSNVVNGHYGSTVASAGDVNGDGYADVIVGAPNVGQNSTGRAYVYHGSQNGLAAAAAWIVDGVQIQTLFGASVASAGDVNGDGYSDVIVGATHYDGQELPQIYSFDEGAAYVYLGSPGGLSTTPAWSAESNQHSAFFGVCVATAGDVNGDGFSDVLVGTTMFDNGQSNEGAAFVYLGSSSGLSTSANTTIEGDQADALFGATVASAGDVNGDGYSDVIVAARTYDNGHSQEGAAFLYLGSSTGLSNSAAWTVEGNQTFGGLGYWVAPAGDANGDGFSDVLLEGTGAQVWLYLGNEGRGGWTLTPQQRQASDVTPIQLLTRSSDNLEFRIHLAFARTLAGFAWASGIDPVAKLEWEVEALSSPLDGDNVQLGLGEEAIDGSLLRFNEIASFKDDVAPLTVGIGHHQPARSHPFHWRARIRTNNPLFPVTPWVTIPGNNVSETKLRAGPVRARR